ncbi:hypothetical protein Tco_1209435 [Tanacetum coccineum]
MDDNDASRGLIRVFFIIILDGERGHKSTSFTHPSLGRQKSQDYYSIIILRRASSAFLGPVHTGMDVHQSKGQGSLPDGRCITSMNGKERHPSTDLFTAQDTIFSHYSLPELPELLGFKDSYNTVSAVQLFKLDMSSIKWEEMKDLKETLLYISHNSYYSEFYSHAIASSDLGGYIHILGDKGKTINSYHVKDKNISLSSMPCLVGTKKVSAWPLLECRLEAHHADHKQKEEDKDAEIVERLVKDDEIEFNSSMNDESHLLNLPFHILEMIMKFCVGVEYLKFRATCKCCHLAAPLVQWINEASLERLQISFTMDDSI